MEVLFDGHPARRGHHLDDDQRARPCRSSACTWWRPSGRGSPVEALNGTLQTDIFKEYIAQKEWLFPPEPHLRLIGDLMEYCDRERSRRTSRSRSPATTSARPARRPRRSWRTRWPTGSATSSWGCPAAWTSTCSRPGCPSSSTPTSTSSRRSPSSGPPAGSGRAGCATSTAPRTEKAQWLRFHTQTAGVSLTAQQPDNNVVRTAVEALAAVLGGTNSLHTNALDEMLALPVGQGRRDRAAHPAGADGGDRRRQRRRPARRLLVRRGAHRRDRGRGRARSSRRSGRWARTTNR